MQRVTLDLRVQQVPQVRLVQLAHRVQQVRLGPQAQRVQQVQLEQREPQVLREQLVRLEQQVRQERKVLQDLLGLRVLLVRLALRVQLEQALQRCQIF